MDRPGAEAEVSYLIVVEVVRLKVLARLKVVVAVAVEAEVVQGAVEVDQPEAEVVQLKAIVVVEAAVVLDVVEVGLPKVLAQQKVVVEVEAEAAAEVVRDVVGVGQREVEVAQREAAVAQREAEVDLVADHVVDQVTYNFGY